MGGDVEGLQIGWIGGLVGKNNMKWQLGRLAGLANRWGKRMQTRGIGNGRLEIQRYERVESSNGSCGKSI